MSVKLLKKHIRQKKQANIFVRLFTYQNKRLTLTFITMLLGAALLYLQGIRPLTLHIEKIEKDIHHKNLILDSLRQDRSDLQLIHKPADDTEKFLVEFERTMPKGKCETWSLRQINPIAARHQIKYSLSFYTPASKIPRTKILFPGSQYDFFTLNIETFAETKRFLRFLHDLERTLQKTVFIDEIKIVSSQGEQPDIHEISLKVAFIKRVDIYD